MKHPVVGDTFFVDSRDFLLPENQGPRDWCGEMYVHKVIADGKVELRSMRTMVVNADDLMKLDQRRK